MPQSGPEAIHEKPTDAESDSSSEASGGHPDITIVRHQPPPTPARQKSSDSNRTEPSDDKKGKSKLKVEKVSILNTMLKKSSGSVCLKLVEECNLA